MTSEKGRLFKISKQLYKDRELMCQKLIVENKTYSEVAKELSCSYTAVRNWAIKFGFQRVLEWEILDKKYGNDICSSYIKGALLNELADKYKVNCSTIRTILKKHDIPLKNRSQIKQINDNKKIHRKYSLNEDYFKKWSSNMAYILGVIASDGCIKTNEYKNGSMIKKKYELVISLKDSDKELLEKIKKEIEYKGNIYCYKSNYNTKYCTLRISSKKIINDLKNIGIHERKSLNLKMPCIPKEYELDFIRGYFDGDGSIGSQYPTNSKGKRTKTQQIRFRICSGSRQILEQIENIFFQHGLKHKKVTKRRNLYEILYSTKECYKIYELLYYNPNAMCLKRKKDKFKTLIKIRNEQLQNK
ncbi:LAGLIDADG family homing endonuclease [Bacillus smithii]|uniref:LAGLIDADG family homing endonuclease n=1 Tax=Bacillus smithii TaxID=1479 RepID=UPI003D230F63